MSEKLEIVLVDAGSSGQPQGGIRQPIPGPSTTTSPHPTATPSVTTGQAAPSAATATPQNAPTDSADRARRVNESERAARANAAAGGPEIVDAQAVPPVIQRPNTPEPPPRGIINRVKQTIRKIRGSRQFRSAMRLAQRTRVGRAAIGIGQRMFGLASDVGGVFGGGIPNNAMTTVARGTGATAASTSGAATAAGAATRAIPPVIPSAAAGGAGAVAAGGGAGSAAAGGAAGGAAAGGGALAIAGPIGIAVGAVILIFGALAFAAKKLVDVFKGQADQLEDYSANIASARAQTEYKMILAQLNRANTIGPNVAKVEEARGQLQVAVYNVQSSIYEILSRMAPAVQLGLDYLTVQITKFDAALALAEVIRSRLTPDPLDNEKSDKRLAAALERLTEAKTELIADLFMGGDSSGDGMMSKPLMDVLTLPMPLPARGRGP